MVRANPDLFSFLRKHPTDLLSNEIYDTSVIFRNGRCQFWRLKVVALTSISTTRTFEAKLFTGFQVLIMYCGFGFHLFCPVNAHLLDVYFTVFHLRIDLKFDINSKRLIATIAIVGNVFVVVIFYCCAVIGNFINLFIA